MKSIDAALSIIAGPVTTEAIKNVLDDAGYSIVPKVEVTPAMIAAGREPISSKWLEFTGLRGAELWDGILTEVFQAMWEARNASPHTSALREEN